MVVSFFHALKLQLRFILYHTNIYFLSGPTFWVCIFVLISCGDHLYDKFYQLTCRSGFQQ